MKKNIAIILNISSLIIISDALGIGYKLMAFLFAGIVPFTNIVLNSIQMMILMFVMLSVTLIRVFVMPIIKRNMVQVKANQTKIKVTAKKLSRA